jgi:ATP-dependent DNA helicase PIF1
MTSQFHWGEYALDIDQQRILQYAIAGHHIFLTGAAGTGKSITLRHLIHILRLAYPKQHAVAITAPTGIAAFPLGGYTLHSWGGLDPNNVKYPVADLVRGVRSRRGILHHWLRARVLVIDEVSLVNREVFEKLDAMARALRKQDVPFGGIQVIVCGDFLQLPPIQDQQTQSQAPTQEEKNTFCFQSPLWKEMFANTTYCLQTVHRSVDPEWTQVLDELRRGDLSGESRVLLKSRVRKAGSPDLKGIRLFPRRKQVDDWNREKLEEREGDEYCWQASEVGEEYDRDVLDRCCLAPRKLVLKVGSPVLLLKNLNMKTGLINGRQGTVLRMEPFNAEMASFVRHQGKDATQWMREQTVPGQVVVPVVLFGRNEVVMEPAEWNYTQGHTVRATRCQFPLLLADSISTHKAQGMTLERAVVDLRGIFTEGQAYVGLSRVRSLEGLTCLGTIPFRVIRAHPDAVEYWDTIQSNRPPPLNYSVGADADGGEKPLYLRVGYWGRRGEDEEVFVLQPEEGMWRIWVVGTQTVETGALTTEEWIQVVKESMRQNGNGNQEKKKSQQLDMRIWTRKTP